MKIIFSINELFSLYFRALKLTYSDSFQKSKS